MQLSCLRLFIVMTYTTALRFTQNLQHIRRVEHIFGHMSKAMGGKFVRCVGLLRTVCEITLKNLAYNMSRTAYLKHKPLPT